MLTGMMIAKFVARSCLKLGETDCVASGAAVMLASRANIDCVVATPSAAVTVMAGDEARMVEEAAIAADETSMNVVVCGTRENMTGRLSAFMSSAMMLAENIMVLSYAQR